MMTILNEMERIFQRPLSTGVTEDDQWIQMWLETAAMFEYRRELLGAASDFGLCLYGDEGWKELVDDKVGFRGWIDNRTDLPRLYNATKINLNISKPQAKSTLPLRVFDICSCGGFMLTDYRHDVATLFDRNEEIVVYNDGKDLRRKVEYYLTHPQERKEIAQRARSRVLKEHTFLHRMREILSIVSTLKK
jgi:spore maturation protein CgeB